MPLDSEKTSLTIEEKVYLDRVNLFFDHAAGNIARGLVGGLMIGAVMYYSGCSLTAIAIWYAGLSVVSGATYFVDYKFSKTQLKIQNARLWLIRRIFNGSLIGVMYGISPFLLPPEASFEAILILFMVLSTLVSVASIGYAVMPVYYLLLNAFVMWPITISFFATLDFAHIVMITISILWQIVVLSKVSVVTRTTIGALYTNQQLQQEIDERMKAEQALRESEDRFKTLSTATFEGIIITKEGRITDVNKQFIEMSGYHRQELIGKNIQEMILPEDIALVKKNYTQEQVRPYEITGIKKNGDKIILEVRGKSLSYKGENIRVSAIRDITRNKQIEVELKTLASTDTLTGLPNRRSGILFLQKQLNLAKRKGFPLTVCFIDVDGLKTVNDIYGHELGDELIKSSGSILSTILRDSDLVCRLGGDEFLVIFSDCNLKCAAELWGRIETELKHFNDTKGKSYQVSFSHGFSEFTPSSKLGADELISMADSNMYSEKKRKRSVASSIT